MVRLYGKSHSLDNIKDHKSGAVLENLLPFLRFNHYPASAKSNELKHLLSEDRIELDRCEAEISRLQDLLTPLQEQRDRLYRHMSMTESLRAPIRKLPPEILSQVFQNYAEIAESGHLFDIPALTLTSVCAHWRNTALAVQGLWSDIRINVQQAKKSQVVVGESAPFLLDTLIARSGKLALKLCMNDPMEVVQVAAVAMITPILRRNCRRWQALTIPVLVLQNMPDFAGPWSILESLSLSGYFPGLPAEITTFQASPRLRTVMCSGREAVGVPIPWSQITHFHFHSLSSEDVVKMLSLCPVLIKIHLSVMLGSESTPVHHGTSRLQCLSMQMDGDVAPDIAALFDALTLPELSSLILSYEDSLYELEVWPMAAFSRLLSRSACIITNLNLDSIPFPHSVVTQILELLPSLVTLAISDPTAHYSKPGTPTVTKDLMLFVQTGSRDPNRPILPCLRHIQFSVLWNASWSNDVFIDMIKARWRPGSSPSTFANNVACLESVRLKIRAPAFDYPPSLVDPIRDLKREGLNIYITVPRWPSW